MTKKIFRSMLLSCVVVLLCALAATTGCLYRYFSGVQEQQLREELTLAAAAVETDGTAYLTQIEKTACRLTWVAADGTVLYDTQADAAAMENHGQREEIRQALLGGSGSSTRYSATLTEKTVYRAVRLSDGSVLRISGSQATAWMLALGMVHVLLAVAALAAALSALLAKRTARRVVEPLNALDLEHPMENNAYEELSPLLRRIHAQQQEIGRQTRSLRQRQAEFRQITGHMREGLVLLNRQGEILSMNPAAQKIFGADGDCTGRDFLTVDRRPDISGAISEAVETGHRQLRAERTGRNYQFDISRIDNGETAAGVVVLAVDVSEQAEAERMRREFTANVSHELKTPLQSIIGSAELLENGWVKPEDETAFAARIHREAERLVALIGDVIRLSQLDEGETMPRESVSLRALAEESAASLTDMADARDVQITVEGSKGTLTAVRRLMQEIVRNLLENAVKYNVPGGSVRLGVSETEREVTLRVEDTGIGIAPEDQSRIFERFYRGDKSHSHTVEGTGLGLSIVKHAVAYHRGRIALESAPGKGTVITVTLPKE